MTSEDEDASNSRGALDRAGALQSNYFFCC